MKILLITKSKFPPGVSLWQSQKSIIHLILNFTTMKKSIFILFMALFASFQLLAQTPHDPPTCTSDAGSPAVGVLYTYQVSIPNTGGYTGTGTFDWYVMTQGQLDLLTGGHIGPAVNPEFTASGYYDVPTGSANTIDITWTSVALATGQPYFLVVLYAEPTVCTPTDNMKVYRIMPKNAFWLKADNVTTVQCAAAISSAIITNQGNPGQVEYLYGTNTLVMTVTATGYTGLWDAQLQLGGLVDPSQTVAVTWAAAPPSVLTGTFTCVTVNGIYTSATQLPSLDIGQVITITIVVTNNHYENLAGQTINIAIDGSYTSGASTFNDLSDVNGNCTPELAFADAVAQTISARPTITPVNPPAFVPQIAP
jgi:hypothetical protein